MTLRSRLILNLNGLLLLTVVLIAGVTMSNSVADLREYAKQDALGTAALLANAATLAVEAVPSLKEPADGWPSPQARSSAVAARRLAERDAWRHAAKKLAKTPCSAGNFQAVFVAQERGQLLAWYSPDKSRDLVSEYWNTTDVIASQTTANWRPIAQFQGDSLTATAPLKHDGGSGWAFICKFDTHGLNAAVRSSIHRLILLCVGGLLAGAAVSIVLADRISKPVRRLAEAAKVIGAGEFNHRVKVESQDELGSLADSFNKMAGSLEQTLARLASVAAAKEAQSREMEIAREIQRSLLPDACPQLKNFDVAAVTLPAHEVGGDFYDFIPLSDGRWGIVVADASGKGVPAALLMALSRSLVRAYSKDRPSVLNALTLANDFILEDVHSDMFVTCFYAVIDPQNRSLTYVNAGHNPAVVSRKKGDVVTLRASGTPLGIEIQSDLKEESCLMTPDDLVVIYTDGITEAVNSYGEGFGVQRLNDIVRHLQDESVNEVCERVLTAVNTFASGEPQFDDMTLVVLRTRVEEHAEPTAPQPEAVGTA